MEEPGKNGPEFIDNYRNMKQLTALTALWKTRGRCMENVWKVWGNPDPSAKGKIPEKGFAVEREIARQVP